MATALGEGYIRRRNPSVQPHRKSAATPANNRTVCARHYYHLHSLVWLLFVILTIDTHDICNSRGTKAVGDSCKRKLVIDCKFDPLPISRSCKRNVRIRRQTNEDNSNAYVVESVLGLYSRGSCTDCAACAVSSCKVDDCALQACGYGRSASDN
jgi:hypothetical protein